MDILAYCAVIGALFLLASIVDLLRSCLKELRQIRDMLRTSQLVELQKVMKEAGWKRKKRQDEMLCRFSYTIFQSRYAW